jgi:hypothetical protein
MVPKSHILRFLEPMVLSSKMFQNKIITSEEKKKEERSKN